MERLESRVYIFYLDRYCGSTQDWKEQEMIALMAIKVLYNLFILPTPSTPVVPCTLEQKANSRTT